MRRGSRLVGLSFVLLTLTAAIQSFWLSIAGVFRLHSDPELDHDEDFSLWETEVGEGIAPPSTTE